MAKPVSNKVEDSSKLSVRAKKAKAHAKRLERFSKRRGVLEVRAKANPGSLSPNEIRNAVKHGFIEKSYIKKARKPVPVPETSREDVSVALDGTVTLPATPN